MTWRGATVGTKEAPFAKHTTDGQLRQIADAVTGNQYSVFTRRQGVQTSHALRDDVFFLQHLSTCRSRYAVVRGYLPAGAPPIEPAAFFRRLDLMMLHEDFGPNYYISKNIGFLKNAEKRHSFELQKLHRILENEAPNLAYAPDATWHKKTDIAMVASLLVAAWAAIISMKNSTHTLYFMG